MFYRASCFPSVFFRADFFISFYISAAIYTSAFFESFYLPQKEDNLPVFPCANLTYFPSPTAGRS
jgi:hypothetical protein